MEKKLESLYDFKQCHSGCESVRFESESALLFFLESHKESMTSDFKANRGIETHLDNEVEYD